MMRNRKDITDDELDSFKDALGFWNKGEGILTRQEFEDVFINCKYPLPFGVAVKAYKWFVKNNFEI